MNPSPRLAWLALAATSCTVPNPLLEAEVAGSGSSGTASGASTDDGSTGPGETMSSGVSSDAAVQDGTGGPTGRDDNRGDGSGSSAGHSTTGSDGGEASSGTGSSDGPSLPECESTHECVPAPPLMWSSPARAHRRAYDDPAVSCEDDYATLLWAAGRDIQGDAITCSCVCQAFNASCTTSVSIAHFTDVTGQCSGAPETQTVPAGSCLSIVGGASAGDGWRAEPPTLRGSCIPDDVRSAEVDPFFAERIEVCGQMVEPPACGLEGVCVPQAEAGELCIARDGEHECPEAYPVGQTYYEALDDQRFCEGCECGDIEGSCGGQARLYVDAQCDVQVGQVPADGACEIINNSPTRVGFEPGEPQPVCNPASPSTVTGELNAISPVTVCCLE